MAAALDWFAAHLRTLDYRAAGTRVLKLGRGKTCEVLAAFVLADAHSELGLDCSLALPGIVLPARFQATAQILEKRPSRFLNTVASSAELVRQQCEVIVASKKEPVKFQGYNGWSIPLADDSVDLIVSRSVLEHVNMASVEPLLDELRRVLWPDGGMVHVIDLRDPMHLINDGSVTGGPCFSRCQAEIG